MTDQMQDVDALRAQVDRLRSQRNLGVADRDETHAAMVAQRATHAEIEAELRAQRDDLTRRLATTEKDRDSYQTDLAGARGHIEDLTNEISRADGEATEARAQRDDLADHLAKAMSENANLTLQNVALRASLKRADHAKAALTASEDRYRDLVLRAQKAEAHAAMLAAQVDEQADQIETGTADRAAAAAKAADIVPRDKDGYYNVDDLIAIATYIEKGKP